MDSPSEACSVAIVGAGPYGLSLAAHLQKTGVTFRIFGTPMQNWAQRMPKGMMLKSEGFASSLYDPDRSFTLGHFCRENAIPYQDIGAPITCETFVAYGLEFQRRLVPTLEQTDILSIERHGQRFLLTTASGETLMADRVVLAVGITHFAFVPPTLESLPAEYRTHSLDHYDLTRFAGRKVAVVGGGASAVDLAGLLAEAGAESHLIARRDTIAFHAPTAEPRSLRERVLKPRSGLGLGWRSRMCTDAPLLFHRLPSSLRARIVQRHLGPAPGWFARQKVEGHVTFHLGSTIQAAAIANGQVNLGLLQRNGHAITLAADHVIAATGFQPRMARLGMLAPSLQGHLRVEPGGAPILSTSFESSVPGLYFVGLASANAFGPVARFAVGARFTGKHLARHLAATRTRTRVRAAVGDLADAASVLLRTHVPRSSR